jgi:hypothetical protein
LGPADREADYRCLSPLRRQTSELEREEEYTSIFRALQARSRNLLYRHQNKICFPKFVSRAQQLNWPHLQFVPVDLNNVRENATWLLIGRKTEKKYFFSLFLNFFLLVFTVFLCKKVFSETKELFFILFQPMRCHIAFYRQIFKSMGANLA